MSIVDLAPLIRLHHMRMDVSSNDFSKRIWRDLGQSLLVNIVKSRQSKISTLKYPK